MKKNLARLVMFIFVVVFALGSVGSAFASQNDPPEPVVYPACLATASALTGPAPLTVQFVAHSNNESAAYAWFFGGGEKPSGTGSVVSNKYSGVGEYRVRLVCEDGTRGFYNHANLLIITVTPSEDPTIQKPEDNSSGDGVGNSGSATDQTGLGITSGDNSPVVNGNGNIVFVVPQKEEKPVVQQPLNITVNIEPEPISTQKTNWFTAFIHAFLKGNEVFLRTLDESWFKPELVN